MALLVLSTVIVDIVGFKGMDLQELCQVVPKHVYDWEVADVTKWLQYISFHHLTDTFQSNRIEGWQLLLITEEDLIHRLKVKSSIQRKKLMNWVSFLSDNSRLLHTMIKRHDCRQDIGCEDGPFTSSMTSSELSTNLEVIEDTVNWGQLESTRKGKFSGKNHFNLYVYQRFRGDKRFFSCNRGRSLTIGKAADNIICILEPQVDLHHCSIIHKKQDHYLKPEPSTTGVWIKIKSILPIDHTYLIQMGYTLFVVDQDQDCLLISAFDGIQANKSYGCYRYPPQHKTVKIGRSSNYDLSFSSDSTMSSVHGKFTFIQGTWYFEDLLTTNGSWYRCSEETLLTDKSTFRITRSQFIFDCKLLDSDDGTTVSSVQSKGICRVCKTAEKNSYFVPCSHSNCCLSCANAFGKCLQCARDIVQIHKIYR